MTDPAIAMRTRGRCSSRFSVDLPASGAPAARLQTPQHHTQHRVVAQRVVVDRSS